jgi:hypothetical protein
MLQMHRAFGPAFLISLAALAGHARPAAAQNPTVASQGSQSNSAYAASFAASHVTNVFVTTEKTSCYRPEVPFFVSNAPSNGYSGMSNCVGANTGEDTGLIAYPTQVGSNPGYPATTPMLVTRSRTCESTRRIPRNTDPVGAFDGFGNYYELILPYMFFYNKDTTHKAHRDGNHLGRNYRIWFLRLAHGGIVSAEGYNHLLGFYESFDGGRTWPVQGPLCNVIHCAAFVCFSLRQQGPRAGQTVDHNRHQSRLS